MEIISHLKDKNMRDISDVVESIRDYYPTNSTFTLDEFQDAFGMLLDEHAENFFLLLENQHDADGEVDLYESLATCVILCGDDFDSKIQFIFSLFDFNRSESIDQQELVLNNQAAIRGLCKIASIPPPTLKQIEDYSLSIFKEVDSDKGGTISSQEYSHWIKFNWELQDFFLRYANVQTFENAERRCKEFKFVFEKLFNAIAGNSAEFLDANLLEPILNKELKETSDGTMNILMNVLKATSKVDYPDLQEGQIYKKSYLSVMKSWGAFDSTDINGDNKLQIAEIKYLLYAYEGDIPDESRIQYEMEQLDKDGSGYITRREWMEYLCIDPNNTQKAAFRSGLKDLFQEYDTDNSGFLTKKELFELLKQQMAQYTAIYQAKGGKDLENYYGMVNSITNEIMEQIEGKYETGQVSWQQFKIFMEKAYTEMDNLKSFLNSIM